jgi:hypothetical protein
VRARATERSPIGARQERHAAGRIIAHPRYLCRGPVISRFVCGHTRHTRASGLRIALCGESRAPPSPTCCATDRAPSIAAVLVMDRGVELCCCLFAAKRRERWCPARPPSAPPSRHSHGCSSRAHQRLSDVRKSVRICQWQQSEHYARSPTDAPATPRNRRPAGLFRCAREDSNLHGPYSAQGPQPDTTNVDESRSVQSVQLARFARRIGRVWRGGCSQSVLTRWGRSTMRRGHAWKRPQ